MLLCPILTINMCQKIQKNCLKITHKHCAMYIPIQDMSDGRAVRGVDSCNSQTLLSRVRVRLAARADTCLGWDTWRYPVIRATRRPNNDPSGGQNTMRR